MEAFKAFINSVTRPRFLFPVLLVFTFLMFPPNDLLFKINKKHGLSLERAVVIYGKGDVILKGKDQEYKILGNIRDIELSLVVGELTQRRLLVYEGNVNLEKVLGELLRTHPEYAAKELN